MERKNITRIGSVGALLILTALFLAAAASIAAAQSGTISGKVTVPAPKYLQETVVYVTDAPSQFPASRKTMDQKGLQFVPHVLTITRGDTVEFLNHDTVAHNVFTSDFETYNLGTFKPGETRTQVFSDTTGVYTQLCSIHPEMLGYIFVGQNPYSAVVDANGNYTINAPPGTYQLAVWNSHFNAPQQTVNVASGQKVEADFALKR